MPANNKHSRLFVQRFKTEPCRTFDCEGTCPYEERCMFAHGAVDLRTEEMNIADGLVNDSAVRKWQRHHRAVACSSGSDSADESKETLPVWHPAHTTKQVETNEPAVTSAHTQLWYRHNPYGFCDILVVKPVRG